MKNNRVVIFGQSLVLMGVMSILEGLIPRVEIVERYSTDCAAWQENLGFVRMLEPGVIIYDSADPSANRIKEAFSGTVSVRLIQVNAGSHNAMIMEEQYHPLNTTGDLVDLILA